MLRSVTGPMAAKVVEITVISARRVRHENEIIVESAGRKVTNDKRTKGTTIDLHAVLESL